MTVLAVDRRSHDLMTAPRAAVEESWMDVHAGTAAARDELGHALIEKVNRRDPWPRIFAADRRLARLDEFARRHAAEAAGITYISPNQMPLFDGCVDPDDRSA
jgi:hypothetical protein